MKKGKIIIVGATGVIGNAALERFVSSGWDVISVSRRKPECKSGEYGYNCPKNNESEKGDKPEKIKEGEKEDDLLILADKKL